MLCCDRSFSDAAPTADGVIAGAAAATVVGVMRFLGFLCIAAYGVVRYML